MQVKFFERVKLERKIESLNKKIQQEGSSEKERTAASALLARSKEDLQVQHFSKGNHPTGLKGKHWPM